MIKLSTKAREFLALNKYKKIVFTNGCFDILHPGHVQYLQEARALGDVLLVGLNADASVRTLKGPDRPINNEKFRQKMLEALRAVDFVEIFEEETPYRLIGEVGPQVLVKGGDYKLKDIVGYDIVTAIGGEVRTLNFVDGFSSSKIIEQIKTKGR